MSDLPDYTKLIAVNVDIPDIQIGHVKANITSCAVTLDVNVTNSPLVISGDVTVTSGVITISTSGGTNIVIDLLTQSAYKSRTSELANYGESPTWATCTGNARKGKFFPRGARGFIYSVGLYCKDVGASGGTVTFYLAPYPGASAVYTVNLSVPASSPEGWIDVTFGRMWNYDSLFIYFVCSSSDIQVCYDGTEPVDAYISTNAGATWSYQTQRWYTRAHLVGQTVGDVTVSGSMSLGDRSAYGYAHVTADAQVKASPGRLHTVTINTVTTGGVLTIYDNIDENGTVIAIITLVANDKPVTLTYDVLCKTGIYAGFDGTLVADITISYI